MQLYIRTKACDYTKQKNFRHFTNLNDDIWSIQGLPSTNGLITYLVAQEATICSQLFPSVSLRQGKVNNQVAWAPEFSSIHT